MEDEHNSNRRNNGSADKIDAEQEIRQKPVVNFTYKRKSRNLGTEGEAERQATTQSREQNPQNDDVHRSQLTEENHEPMPEAATKKQKKQQTRKKGTKTTATKRVQFITNEDDEPESAKIGLSIIKTRSWTGLLRHRMAPSGFLTLIERLDYEQWSAVMDSGFGGMLSVRTNIIPKRMARWLLEHYDPWDNSLNLPNGKIQIDEEDVYATLGLPLGGQEITEGNISEADTEFVEMCRRRWNVPKRGPPKGSMDELILERGGHSNEFITDFITYAISTCIVGNANGTCQSRVVKHLRNVEDIKNYNWCGYTVKCLNEAVVEWKKDKSKFFI